MLLDLEQYKRQCKKETEQYVWRIQTNLYSKIKEVASENKVYPSVVMRYIINWSCDKMESDEQFREHMLEITLGKNDSEGKKKYMYTISKNVNDKLLETNKKYRLNNINFFVVESARLFFETYEQ
jgi:hypothetical protein